jgi:hypothetical protein
MFIINIYYMSFCPSILFSNLGEERCAVGPTTWRWEEVIMGAVAIIAQIRLHLYILTTSSAAMS